MILYLLGLMRRNYRNCNYKYGRNRNYRNCGPIMVATPRSGESRGSSSSDNPVSEAKRKIAHLLKIAKKARAFED